MRYFLLTLTWLCALGVAPYGLYQAVQALRHGEVQQWPPHTLSLAISCCLLITLRMLYAIIKHAL